MRAAWHPDLSCSGVQFSYLPTRKPNASLQSSGLEDRKAIIFNSRHVAFIFTEGSCEPRGHFTGRCLQVKSAPGGGCSGLFSTLPQSQSQLSTVSPSMLSFADPRSPILFVLRAQMFKVLMNQMQCPLLKLGIYGCLETHINNNNKSLLFARLEHEARVS